MRCAMMARILRHRNELAAAADAGEQVPERRAWEPTERWSSCSSRLQRRLRASCSRIAEDVFLGDAAARSRFRGPARGRRCSPWRSCGPAARSVARSPADAAARQRGAAGLPALAAPRPVQRARRFAACGVLACRAAADDGDDGVDRDGLAFGDLDLGEGAGGGRGDLGVDLVGGDLEERLVALDRVADLLEPLGDGALEDGLAHLRHQDFGAGAA